MLWTAERKSTSLIAIADQLFAQRGPRSKASHYYAKYESYFRPLRDSPCTIFELGVFNGESTKVFSRYFSRSKIVGIDIELRPIDLSGFDNVTLAQCDQSDEDALANLVAEHAPGGIDIVIDDASHIGSLSKRTFEILFPKVVSGGLYIVEDWGTGYWSDWPDGEVYQTHETRPFHPGELPKRIVSHDYGMVGFIKHIVDLAGMSDNRPIFAAAQKVTSQIKGFHIFPGTSVIEKA
jgi:hypothetical protein